MRIACIFGGRPIKKFRFRPGLWLGNDAALSGGEVAMAWYCLQTKAKSEQAVEHSLKRQGYEVYCPMVRVDRRRVQNRDIECMFPRYLFFRITPEILDYRPATKTPGVVSMVRFGTWFAQIADNIISDLRRHEDEQGIHRLAKVDYAKGDRIMITSGLLQGYRAIVEAPRLERIVVLLDMASQVSRVELSYRDIEPAPAGRTLLTGAR
jgi:transcriptional antiterminator RfaH